MPREIEHKYGACKGCGTQTGIFEWTLDANEDCPICHKKGAEHTPEKFMECFHQYTLATVSSGRMMGN